MKKQELETIFAQQTAAVIAPAGHGKTEMIVDMVEYTDSKQLLLTHTHAGVDALQKRLNHRGIPKTKYTISTIASFCMKWGMAYCHTSAVDTSLSPYSTKDEVQRYYSQFYDGAKRLFQHKWAGRILQESYAGIIVDEYQDCLQSHHEMFLVLSQYLPVRVLGDPLQGIFSFGDQQIVDWNCLGYPIVDVVTSPWRWSKANPSLGKYLNDVRDSLWPALTGQQCMLHIDSCNGSICVIDPQHFDVYSMLREFRQYTSVLYLSKWEAQQTNFCLRHPNIFQLDEKQECEDLFKFANSFSNKSGAELLLEIVEFESKCATKVNAELNSYKKRLAKGSLDFGRITKNREFGSLLESVHTANKHETIIRILEWFEKNPIFKCYRKELCSEMVRSVKYARDHGISIFEAAEHIRKDPTLQKRYQGFKCLSSRTLLSKGLEFDCVIIDMSIPLSAKEFYVALTRAMRKIYILSPTRLLTLNP